MKRILLLTPALLLLAGCDTIHWLRPLYSDGDLVKEPGLVGQWRDKDGTLTVKPDDDGYALIYEEGKKDEPPLKFNVHLARLGGDLYADAVRDDQDLPTHHYFRLELNGDTLRIFDLNGNWAIAQMKAHALPFELVVENKGKDHRYVVTATTAAVQSFLTANRNSAWDKPNEMKRVTAKPSSAAR